MNVNLSDISRIPLTYSPAKGCFGILYNILWSKASIYFLSSSAFPSCRAAASFFLKSAKTASSCSINAALAKNLALAAMAPSGDAPSPKNLRDRRV